MQYHVSYIPDDIDLSSTISLCEDDHTYSFLIGKICFANFTVGDPDK